MAHVVTKPCDGCKYTECVVVCPCDCFHEGERMLFIDPVACIDCQSCANECPVSAIYQDVDVPEEWRDYIELNARMSRELPGITEKRQPLALA